MSFPTGLRILGIAGMLAGAAAQVEAQTLSPPHASALWMVPATREIPPSARVSQSASSKGHGLLLGAVIGGLAAGFLGNRVCHAYGTTVADGCAGETLWWAAVGGMLGGLIGATAGSESSSPSGGS